MSDTNVTIKSVSEPEINGTWEVRMMTFEEMEGEYRHLRMSTSDYPFNLTAGTKCVYTSVVDDRDGSKRVKGLKPAGAGGGGKSYGKKSYGGGGYNDDKRQLLIVKQFSLTAALRLLELQNPEGNVNVTPEKVQELATRFKDWVMKTK